MTTSNTTSNTASNTEQQSNEQQSKPAVLQVHTVEQKLQPGCKLEQVVAATRASEGKTIATANRVRCVVIPELNCDAVPSKFQQFVLSALRRTAVAQLAAMWKAEPSLMEVPASVWSVDSLLLYAAKRAESTRLTKENLLEWFQASKLCEYILEQKKPKMYEDWKLRVQSLAAPVLTLNEAQCTVTIATIGKFDEDSASPMAVQMITKLEKRLADLQVQEQEIEAV